MAKVIFKGANPIDHPESASAQMRASLGEEMTPIKVMQRELCDGNIHIFNVGEEIEVACTCPDLRHLKQFLNCVYFHVDLSIAEQLQIKNQSQSQ